MTSYLETRNVAHVMHLGKEDNGTPVWRTACLGKTRIYPVRYHGREQDWPIRHVSMHDRTRPWCRSCVRVLAARTAELIVDVLAPAVVERHG